MKVIIFSLLLSSLCFSADCKDEEVQFTDESGQVICMKSSERQSLYEEKCLTEPDYCLMASQAISDKNKKEHLIGVYKVGIENACHKKKLASYCAKLAGLLENKHAYKDLLSLPVNEVKERQRLWEKACKLGGEAAKDSFFCFQKDFLSKFKEDLENKCKFKIKDSCHRLKTFKKLY